ncbi:MAG: DUF2149 domain-containing protein [Firmicutes bacterium]|nr:DUF2149 domain-containing protein [Bacillota bacterium]
MRRLSARRITGDADNTVNPMDGLGNLADAMLVLAVGIMLALIIHWNVDITIPETDTQEQTEQQIPLDPNDLQEQTETASSDDMSHIGEIYYDEATGTYYAVMEE